MAAGFRVRLIFIRSLTRKADDRHRGNASLSLGMFDGHKRIDEQLKDRKVCSRC
jgi:hypothetical protein